MAPRRSRRLSRRRLRAQSRRVRSGRRRKNSSVLPPAKTILGHIMRNIIQTAFDIYQGKFKNCPIQHRIHHHLGIAAVGPTNVDYDVTTDTLFDQGNWTARLKPCFRQLKVHRMVVHYMPYAPITAPGEYIMTVSDANENIPPSDKNVAPIFTKLVGTPASVVRKMGQPARLEWYPTEPDDKNWHAFSDGHNICNIEVRSAENNFVVPIHYVDKNVQPIPARQNYYHGDISGKLVCEVDVSFRGVPLPDSVVVPDKCFCKKCMRRDYFKQHLVRHADRIKRLLSMGNGFKGGSEEPTAGRSECDGPSDLDSVSESLS